MVAFVSLGILMRTLSEQCRKLASLKIEDMVSVQNQHGKAPHKWDNTGTVVEVGDCHKYTIKLNSSGRLTLRNRRSLQPIKLYKKAISHSAQRKNEMLGKLVKPLVHKRIAKKALPTAPAKKTKVS